MKISVGFAREGYVGIRTAVGDKAAKGDAEDLDALAAEARRQIDEKNYAASLVAEGITDIMKFGIAFFAKRAAIAK